MCSFWERWGNQTQEALTLESEQTWALMFVTTGFYRDIIVVIVAWAYGKLGSISTTDFPSSMILAGELRVALPPLCWTPRQFGVRRKTILSIRRQSTLPGVLWRRVIGTQWATKTPPLYKLSLLQRARCFVDRKIMKFMNFCTISGRADPERGGELPLCERDEVQPARRGVRADPHLASHGRALPQAWTSGSRGDVLHRGETSVPPLLLDPLLAGSHPPGCIEQSLFLITHSHQPG